MKILIVDDDTFFSEPLIWRLECEGYDVVYCQYVGEVLCGWYEITARCLGNLREQAPASAIQKLELALGERFESQDEFSSRLAELIGRRELELYGDNIFKWAAHNPLKPKPDCILLDMMMPRGGYYGKSETRDGKYTGARLLRDILDRVGNIPVIVVTVLHDVDLQYKLRKDFGRVLKDILVKPVTPGIVIDKLKGIYFQEGL